MHTQQYDLVIIGAGLTGLTLAHYLRNSGMNVLILEKKDRPGGVIHTRQEKGFTYEEGPNTGMVKYGEVAELFEAMKAYGEPYIPDDSVKKRFIWKGRRWEALPSGLVSGLTTPLFTWKDKFRLLGEPFRKAGRHREETLDQMVKRRMGRSFLNYAVDPFILGVYAGDPSMIVPAYALPRLYNLEQNYGSFIGGALRKKMEKKSALEQKATKDVFSFRGGLYNLIQGLYRSASPERFRFNVEDTRVTPDGEGFQVHFNHQGTRQQVAASRVVTTVGAYDLPDIFDFLSQQELDRLSNLQYARVIHAAVGFKQWKGPELEGFGGLVPHIENRDILGALFMSAFLPDRAPDNGALLSVFLGGIRREDIYHRSDDQIIETIRKELVDMFNLPDFNPDLLRINRYSKAIPQYGKESKTRFQTIQKVENRYPGLTIAGNLRDGIGMADRIKQAADIAGQIKQNHAN